MGRNTRISFFEATELAGATPGAGGFAAKSDAHLSQIEKPTALSSCRHAGRRRARQRATEADGPRRRTDLGAAHGVPFTLKDGRDGGVPKPRVTAAGEPGAREDGTVAARPQSAVASLLGKTKAAEMRPTSDSNPILGRQTNTEPRAHAAVPAAARPRRGGRLSPFDGDRLSGSIRIRPIMRIHGLSRPRPGCPGGLTRSDQPRVFLRIVSMHRTAGANAGDTALSTR